MSDIKLKYLEWSNMFSYGPNNRLDLTKHKIVQLDAINGTGKTALVLIIQELLSSKNMKGIKKGDIVNRYSGSDTWTASLGYSINSNEYKLSVTRRGDSSKVSLFENGKDISEHKIPDTYKKILSQLGTTVEVLNQLTYQSSNSQLEFLKATDTNRKKFLVNLFNLEQYLQIGEVIKLKVTEVEKSLNILRGEEKIVEEYLARPDQNLEKKSKITTIPEVSEELKEEIRTLDLEVANYNNLCTAIDKNNLLIQERDGIKFEVDLQDIDQSVYDSQREIIEKLNIEAGSLIQSNNKIQKELGKLDTATHCSQCGQPIDNRQSMEIDTKLRKEFSDNKDKIESLQANIIKERKSYDSLTAQRKAFTNNAAMISKFEQLSSLINNSLQKSYPNISATKKDLVEKKQKLEAQIKDQSDAIKFNNEVDIFNAKIDTLVNQKREFLTRQVLVKDSIINIQSKLDRLAILRKAFSPAGIVAYKLENIIKDFEKEINDYLVELSDGQFQINFRLEGEKLNIVIFSSGIESPIENASEGEFSRIQTATLLAIRKLLSERGGIHINFLFLDEVMGILDSAGKERLIEILQQEEDTNTFIVAHGFSHPLVPQIQIVKENNIARII